MFFLLFRNAVGCSSSLLKEVPAFALHAVFTHGISLAGCTAFLSIALIQPYYPSDIRLSRKLVVMVVGFCVLLQTAACFVVLSISEGNPWIGLKVVRILCAGVAV